MPTSPKQLKDALKGVVHLVMTPFDENEELDEAALHRTVRDAIAVLKNEVEGFVASPPDRPSTLVCRLDSFEALKARAALYRDVLQVHIQDLDNTLDDLTSSIESLLSAKAA